MQTWLLRRLGTACSLTATLQFGNALPKYIGCGKLVTMVTGTALRTRKLSFRITEEAKEYSRLYEKTYYEEVIKVCQRNIEIIDSLHEQTIKMSEDDKR